MGIRANPPGRHWVCSFQPCYVLALTLQNYKDQRRRLNCNGAAVTGRTKHAAISVIVLPLGRNRLRVRGGRHFRANRLHIEGIAYGVSDHAKRRDRCN